MTELKKFFAVTTTSVYEVKVGKVGPEVAKIALAAPSSVGVGEKLGGGYMVAICRSLITYVPEGSGLLAPTSTFERRVEMVNSRWYLGTSSQIVALFKTRLAALRCLGRKDRKPCDPRWARFTLGVIDAIGENHPQFEVCRYPLMALSLLRADVA